MRVGGLSIGNVLGAGEGGIHASGHAGSGSKASQSECDIKG